MAKRMELVLFMLRNSSVGYSLTLDTAWMLPVAAAQHMCRIALFPASGPTPQEEERRNWSNTMTAITTPLSRLLPTKYSVRIKGRAVANSRDLCRRWEAAQSASVYGR
ncbi:unnamed protein product [Effrenium voratum]|nr:unnamed protein product [Effrenium voratum]